VLGRDIQPCGQKLLRPWVFCQLPQLVAPLRFTELRQAIGDRQALLRLLGRRQARQKLATRCILAGLRKAR
jgi:hypothetical protein